MTNHWGCQTSTAIPVAWESLGTGCFGLHQQLSEHLKRLVAWVVISCSKASHPQWVRWLPLPLATGHWPLTLATTCCAILPPLPPSRGPSSTVKQYSWSIPPPQLTRHPVRLPVSPSNKQGVSVSNNNSSGALSVAEYVEHTTIPPTKATQLNNPATPTRLVCC